VAVLDEKEEIFSKIGDGILMPDSWMIYVDDPEDDEDVTDPYGDPDEHCVCD
jgi:hypothetical protein